MEHCGWCGLISSGSLSKGKHTLLITLYWLVGGGWSLEGRKFPQWKVKSTSQSQKRRKQWVMFVFTRNCFMNSTFLTSSSAASQTLNRMYLLILDGPETWFKVLCFGVVMYRSSINAADASSAVDNVQLLKTTHHGYITHRRLHETWMVNFRDGKHEMFNILLLFRIAHINLFTCQPSARRDGWFLSVSHFTVNETIKT